MYIFFNALKNVARNRGRNILLAAIIFAVIAATVVTLMIRNTSDKIIGEYKSMFGSEVSIEYNLQKFIEMRTNNEITREQNVTTLTSEQYIAFADSDLLQNSVFTSIVYVNSGTLVPVGQSDNAVAGGGYAASPNMIMHGNNWDDFENGFRTIIAGNGRIPERAGECAVSAEFAGLNSLSPGDPIQIYGMVLSEDEGSVDPVVYNLTVTGIYHSADEVTAGTISWGGTLTNRLNEILTVSETVDITSAGVAVTARYFLKNPSYLEAFEKEVRAKGLHTLFDVKTDEDTYNAIVGPVEGMRGVTTTFMAVVLILGALVLVLLSSIAVRERKYEIGVLRAMGMKKAKVVLGLWSEMVFITLFCLIIGIGAGSLAAQPVSNSLLSRQIENAQKIKEADSGYFMKQIGGDSRAVDDNPIDEINVTLGADTILQLVVISLLLASAAGFAAAGRITKYEPIKILMDRN